jgi:hypothetical protein
MRQHDLRGVRRGNPGIEHPDQPYRHQAAHELGQHEPDTDAGAMPAKVSENIRPTLIAGLAKLVELVKK